MRASLRSQALMRISLWFVLVAMLIVGMVPLKMLQPYNPNLKTQPLPLTRAPALTPTNPHPDQVLLKMLGSEDAFATLVTLGSLACAGVFVLIAWDGMHVLLI